MTSQEIRKQIAELREKKLELHGEIYGMLLEQGFEAAELFAEYANIFSEISFQNYRQGMAEGKEIYNKPFAL